jgi:hypothetical protein
MDALDVPRAVDFIAACKNFDGGFGCTPGTQQGRMGGRGVQPPCGRRPLAAATGGRAPPRLGRAHPLNPAAA